jgi:hypothetical protein
MNSLKIYVLYGCSCYKHYYKTEMPKATGTEQYHKDKNK